MSRLLVAILAGVMAAAPVAPASAEPIPFLLTIKEHRFVPEVIEVPANQRIVLRIHNIDPTPEEFESYELNREKVVVGGGTINVFLGPLAPGTYPFFGDFNQKTAQGRLIAK
jgi:hypothetical protein